MSKNISTLLTAPIHSVNFRIDHYMCFGFEENTGIIIVMIKGHLDTLNISGDLLHISK